MPTYEYRCSVCKHDFEKFQRMSDPPGAECPVCGGEAIRRLSGGAGLLFKGSGFYITDYRSESYKKAASEGASDGASPAKPASEKTSSEGSRPEKTSTDSSSAEKSSSAKPASSPKPKEE